MLFSIERWSLNVLTIDLGTIERFNPNTNEFEQEEIGIVRFEYSLKVLYEWEGKWRKPFLDKHTKKTSEEIIDFYCKMALDPIKPEHLTQEVMTILGKYVTNPMTATKFNTNVEGNNSVKRNSSGKILTSEEIYALMVSAGIPLEFEHRNLNRLLVILKIISNNSSPPKKMSKSDILKQNAKINAERKARMNTKG